MPRVQIDYVHPKAIQAKCNLLSATSYSSSWPQFAVGSRSRRQAISGTEPHPLTAFRSSLRRAISFSFSSLDSPARLILIGGDGLSSAATCDPLFCQSESCTASHSLLVDRAMGGIACFGRSGFEAEDVAGFGFGTLFVGMTGTGSAQGSSKREMSNGHNA